MEKKKRVGIWIRVSHPDQVEAESPEHHELRARLYIEAKGWEITEIYRLDGVSGKSTFDLPITKKMLRDLHTGRIEALVFSKLARLGRNTKELIEFSEIFQKEKADLVSLAESIDTSTPAGRMFFTLIAAIAQWEREEIASRVAASVPIRAKLGKPLGGAAPFGYRWTSNENGKNKALVIDENEGPIRKRMYDLFLQYKKKGVVANKLNEMGHRTRNGSEFTDTTIGRLLHDSTAKGIRIANYTKSTGNGKKWEYKPESDWVQITCPAIVPAELWDNCNSLLTAQEEQNKRPTKPVVQLFSGILFCECGSKMYVYSNLNKYKCSGCRKTKIEIADIEEIYYENLKIFLLSDDHFDNFLSKANETISEKEKKIDILSQDKKRLQTEMDKTMQLYLAGQIPKDGFAKYYNPLDVQLKQIETTTLETQSEIDILKVDYLDGDTIKYEAKTMYDRWATLDKDAKRSFVEQITNRITIGGDTVNIRFRYHPSYFQNPENAQRIYTDALAFFGVELSDTVPCKTVENPTSIGEHLKKRRLELKIPQKNVANQIGVSEDSITYWENGRSVPQIQFYPKIIQFLGYNPFALDAKSIGGQIYKYRTEHGLSHRKLSKIIGFDPATLAKWEENITIASATDKMKLVIMDIIK